MAALQKRFQDCQSGRLAPIVSNILRKFSFAPHRWESTCDPKRRFIILLGPVLVLLAIKASDARLQAQDRRAAMAMLQQITPELVLTAGLSSDYAEECMRLTRHFDCSNQDPARGRRTLEDFEHRMKALFHEACILDEVPGTVQSSTHIAVVTAKALPPIYVNDKEIRVWPRDAKVQASEVFQSMHAVVDLTLARVAAEVPPDGLFNDLSVFDLASYKEALASSKLEEYKRKCGTRLRRLSLGSKLSIRQRAAGKSGCDFLFERPGLVDAHFQMQA